MFSIEDKQVHQILLRSISLKELGLYQGKMGIAVFFSLYSVIKRNVIYNDIAQELIGDIVTKIHKEMPLNLESGICGIGWALEYLIQHSFVEGDSREVCEELDIFIMKEDIRRMNDLTLKGGLGGILGYVLSHIEGVYSQHKIYPFDDLFLENLFCFSQSKFPDIRCPQTRHLVERYTYFYKTKEIQNNPLSVKWIIESANKIYTEEDLVVYPIGLCNGLAGMILNQYPQYMYL